MKLAFAKVTVKHIMDGIVARATMALEMSDNLVHSRGGSATEGD